jgi:hypothetical protein
MTDLVSLLYRADWTRLSLAAEVNTSRDLDLDRTRYGPGMPPGGSGSSGSSASRGRVLPHRCALSPDARSSIPAARRAGSSSANLGYARPESGRSEMHAEPPRLLPSWQTSTVTRRQARETSVELNRIIPRIYGTYTPPRIVVRGWQVDKKYSSRLRRRMILLRSGTLLPELAQFPASLGSPTRKRHVASSGQRPAAVQHRSTATSPSSRQHPRPAAH